MLETPPPASVHPDQLVGLLASAWGLDVHEIHYVPKGLGSYHWVVVADGGDPEYFVAIDDLDTKLWIGTSRGTTFEGLRGAYDAARSLESQAGLGFVVGPLRCTDGSVIVRLSDQFSMAVFPFVQGHAGTWGERIGRADRQTLLEVLSRLHGTPVRRELRIGVRPLDLPERALLRSVLNSLHSPWHGGPMSEFARAALSDHAADVKGWLDEFDALARRLDTAEAPQVVTHGEPHPGNVVHTTHGLRLIDWDTVAVSRPERDLWMFHTVSPDGLARYEELTGTRVDVAAVRAYELAWNLSDIAYFSALFRGSHEESAWIHQKWNGLRGLLAGENSAPYGAG